MCIETIGQSWVSSLIILHLQFFCFEDMVSLYSSAWLRTSYTDHAGFELRGICLPHMQLMLGLQMCTATPQVLSEPGALRFRQTSCPANPRDPCVSASSVLVLQACTAQLFNMGLEIELRSSNLSSKHFTDGASAQSSSSLLNSSIFHLGNSAGDAKNQDTAQASFHQRSQHLL